MVWALLEGRELVGTTVFSLTDDVDAGPVWGQTAIPVDDGYIGSLVKQCDAAALALIPRVFSPGAEPRPQRVEGASWRPRRLPEDGLIDWSKPSLEIRRWIRAQSRPYPGAFTYLGDERVTIWRAEVGPSVKAGLPGDVIANAVVCGDHRLIAIEEASSNIPTGARLRDSADEGDRLRPGGADGPHTN